MPIYEYICDVCGDRFEWLVRSGEEPACPGCGQKRLSKQLSVPAAHVAGATAPPCPAKESGACGMGGCGSGMCGMSDWG